MDIGDKVYSIKTGKIEKIAGITEVGLVYIMVGHGYKEMGHKREEIMTLHEYRKSKINSLL